MRIFSQCGFGDRCSGEGRTETVYNLPEPYPVFPVTAITHRNDAVSPATIVGIPPMEDFYIGGASLTRPAATLSHRMGEGLGVRVQDELPRDRGHRAAGRRRLSQPRLREHPQDYKIMHGLWGMGQMMFTKYLVVV